MRRRETGDQQVAPVQKKSHNISSTATIATGVCSVMTVAYDIVGKSE